ncbi:MAG: aminopeptidase P family protein [Chloroflexota bacterium]|nr:MAG: aminopeptidase P family protein [Chloroflexota bacterium]
MPKSKNDIYRQRLQAIRAELPNQTIDGLLIGSALNRRWLSGFTGTAGWLLITEDKALLGTDFRYWAQARMQAPDFELVDFRDSRVEAWPGFLHFREPTRIGVEARHLSLHLFDILQSVPNITFVKLSQSLEFLREVKTKHELAAIKAAAAITDQVMAGVSHISRIGMSEKQLAWELERRMREAGASGMAFPVIVASGPNGAMAHHQPGERKLQEGDPIIVDMGAEMDGYASDLTRTFYMGPEPDSKFREIYELVDRAQKAALDGLRAGVTGKEVDSLARDTISSGGYAKEFGHSLGHGIGLAVHEGPSLSQTFGDRPLSAESVVTVEPGIYLPGWGGVRIEDVVRITMAGSESISQCPKAPAIES